MHFLRQRINDTLRGSRGLHGRRHPVSGNATAGEAYFTATAAARRAIRSTGDLAGLATRIPAPVDVQQRMLFPLRGRARRRADANGRHGDVSRQPSGARCPACSSPEDDFFVTLRDAPDVVRVIRKAAGVKIETTDPLRGAPRAARSDHRQEHPRRRRVSGDTRNETRLSLCGRCGSCCCAAALATGRAERPRSRQAAHAARRRVWPTFNGDYSGRRFSTLARDHRRQRQGAEPRVAVRDPVERRRSDQVHAAPDQRRAVFLDARPRLRGRSADRAVELWHYVWPTKGGNHLGNRGMGALGETLYSRNAGLPSGRAQSCVTARSSGTARSAT